MSTQRQAGMNTTLEVGIAGIGLLGPGLPDWPHSVAELQQPLAWQSSPTVVTAPERLPPTERRRAGVGIRAAIGVADEACTMAAIDPALPATVFASATGEPSVCHALCEALATPERAVSPTRFTNSVHNAAAGYWHIAVRSMRPSTSIAAFDATAAMGLLEAVTQCEATRAPVLLVACDVTYPDPLRALRPITDVFAFALLLQPATQPARWRLALSLGAATLETTCGAPTLEALRTGVPAARALPLLEALARHHDAEVVMAGEHGLGLQVQVSGDR